MLIINIFNVKYFYSLFFNCISLKYIPNISCWNSKSAVEMGFLFSGCSSLLSLPDISKWNLKNVKNINAMFSECSSLTVLPDISNWFNYNIDINYTPKDNSRYK